MIDVFELESFENMICFYNEELKDIKNIRNYLTDRRCSRLIKLNIITYNYKERVYELTPETKDIFKNNKKRLT